jgi:adenine deaminase
MKKFSANIVDVLNETVFPGTIYVEDGKIVKIKKETKEYETFILPGFIDAHIHLESSMLTPSEFARISVVHGTVGCVADPHEIANVVGLAGIKFLIEDGKKVNFRFYFSAPSCVPATSMETSGASVSIEEIRELIENGHARHLGEMMNFPGVIKEDPEVMAKIELAKKFDIPIDGHAPGLSGADLEKYVGKGITSDHESFSRREAVEKLKLGMKIIIREGSAAKNFDNLIPLADYYFNDMMFCSDDKHPDDLIKGHINDLVRRAVSKGISMMKALKMACVNPVRHYKLDVGLLQPGDNADFIEVSNLRNLDILRTVINGDIVAENGRANHDFFPSGLINNFNCEKKSISDFEIADKGKAVKVIKLIDDQLVTGKSSYDLKSTDGKLYSDVTNDILKIAVVNRYHDSVPAVSFVQGFGIKEGAIASSVAHDSHNIIIVGTSDEDICLAANTIIEKKGGICYVNSRKNISEVISLPIAGLISNEPYDQVAEKYIKLDMIVKLNGAKVSAPLMALSFMALLVIPSLKLSDLGLFDGEKFSLTDIYESI